MQGGDGVAATYRAYVQDGAKAPGKGSCRWPQGVGEKFQEYVGSFQVDKQKKNLRDR